MVDNEENGLGFLLLLIEHKLLYGAVITDPSDLTKIKIILLK